MGPPGLPGATGPQGTAGAPGATGLVPVYSNTGVLQANQKIVTGTMTLVPNTTPLVVLSGNAVFSNTAYVCSLTMLTGNTAAKLTFNAFAVDRFQPIPSSALDSGVVRYVCIGN